MANYLLVNAFALSVVLLVGGVLGQCHQPQVFTVTCPNAGCAGGFAINGVQNAPINITRYAGCSYTFNYVGPNFGSLKFEIYRLNGGSRVASNFPEGPNPPNFASSYDLTANSGSNSLQPTNQYVYAAGSGSEPAGRVFVNGPDGNWGAWSSCTKACGGGVLTRVCDSPPPTQGGSDCDGPAVSGIPCHTVPCGCRIDCMYVLDGSGSIVPVSWTFLKQFVRDLSSLLDIGNGSLAGIVQFSDQVDTNYETDKLDPMNPPPRMLGSLDLILQTINQMVQLGDSTAMGIGLDFGQKGLVQAGRWSLEPPVPKVILLITDGSSNSGDFGPDYIAPIIKANGTEIFVIGVGGEFNYEQLLRIASEPKIGVHYFNITDYGTLARITNDIAFALCYSRGGSAPPSLYLLFLLLLPLAAGLGFIVFIIRRRKPKKVVPPPEPEPVPLPVKAAAPAPVVDKPKDWTVPGTRYIGFGQANIKVKWGTDAPPSAPRGHDKYDRWSMQAHPGALPSSPSNTSPMLGSESAAPESGQIAAPADKSNCCMRFCPCFFGGAAGASNRTQMAKNANADEGNWQENTAVAAAGSS